MSSFHPAEVQAVAAATAQPATSATPPGAATAAAPASNNQMRVIIAVVGLAMVLFLALSTYTIRKANQGSEQLSQIKSLYFPVLERIDISVVQLDKMEEQYIQAVTTGERDPLGVAAEHQQQADAALAEVTRLYPGQSQDVGALRSRLADYKKQADSTAAAILNKTASDVQGAAAAMGKTLADLRTDIKAFRQASYAQFVLSLEGAQRGAQQNLMLGITAGILNLGFMGVLVYFIRNNVRMIAVVAEQNATLEHRVAERTAQLTQKTNDIAAMLQNMSLGVCTVVPGNRIHPEHSAHLRQITGVQDLAHQPLMEAVFGRSDLGADILDQTAVALGSMIGEDLMMVDFNAHLLPQEMQLRGDDGSARIVQMQWSPIVVEGDIVEKMLLILQDVTHLRELEVEASRQRAQMDTIAQILKVPAGKFNSFMDSARELSWGCRELIQSSSSRDAGVIAELFRNMHTIKGNARMFEFTAITEAAHAAEQRYDQLRQDVDAAWLPAALLADLDAVHAALAAYAHVNDDTLGRKGRAADLLNITNGRGAFLSVEQIVEIKAAVAALATGRTDPAAARAQDLLGGLGLATLDRLVSGAMDAAESLATELGKPTPALALSGGDIGFNPSFAEALKRSLMHIVRNSLDHGIEPPADRQQAGKATQGRLQIDGLRNGPAACLRIRDDGRGLALHRLLDKGRAAGLIAPDARPSRAELASLIFHSGLSTAAAVTQVSGRGVGMDAVRSFLAEQGAEITIELDEPNGDPGFATFAFVVQVPDSACRI